VSDVLDGDVHVGRSAVLVVMLTGCGAGWRRIPAPKPGAFAPRQQAQLWQGDAAHQVHAVVVRPDSISAVPFTRPIECDSCRLTWPRNAVDSVRLGSPVAGFWKGVGLVVAAFAVLCARWCIQPDT
jgi:hypothetical protein